MKRGVVRKFLFPLYYFLALCPFISPVYMPVDVKPFCLIVSAMILFLVPEKIIVPEFFVNILLVSLVGLLALLSQFLLTRGYDFFLPL